MASHDDPELTEEEIQAKKIRDTQQDEIHCLVALAANEDGDGKPAPTNQPAAALAIAKASVTHAWNDFGGNMHAGSEDEFLRRSVVEAERIYKMEEENAKEVLDGASKADIVTATSLLAKRLYHRDEREHHTARVVRISSRVQ